MPAHLSKHSTIENIAPNLDSAHGTQTIPAVSAAQKGMHCSQASLVPFPGLVFTSTPALSPTSQYGGQVGNRTPIHDATIPASLSDVITGSRSVTSKRQTWTPNATFLFSFLRFYLFI